MVFNASMYVWNIKFPCERINESNVNVEERRWDECVTVLWNSIRNTEKTKCSHWFLIQFYSSHMLLFWYDCRSTRKIEFFFKMSVKLIWKMHLNAKYIIGFSLNCSDYCSDCKRCKSIASQAKCWFRRIENVNTTLYIQIRLICQWNFYSKSTYTHFLCLFITKPNTKRPQLKYVTASKGKKPILKSICICKFGVQSKRKDFFGERNFRSVTKL